jgi:AefR-like transcriptional repressor, C-terminal domain
LSIIYQPFEDKQGLWKALVDKVTDMVTATLRDGIIHHCSSRTLFANGPDASRHIVVAHLNSGVSAGCLKIDDINMRVELFCGLVCGDTKLRNACGVLAPASNKDIAKRINAAIDVFLKVYEV